MSKKSLRTILKEVRQCQECAKHLTHGPNPILAVAPETRILIIGQAPGRHVHNTGIPWADQSGDNLRRWMGVTDAQFLDTQLIGTLPMGFCYPGSNPKGPGDAPPRPECAPLWHKLILDRLPNLKLTLVVGQYAMKACLGKQMRRNLTETVRSYEDYLPEYFPLVHPSPLNFRWQAKNKWFEEEVTPVLKALVAQIIK